jgi:NADH-quinone oxidoreductase subunit E
MRTPSPPPAQLSMNAEDNSSETIALSDDLRADIDHWLTKYPPNQRQSAIVPALLIAQRYHQGWLPRALIDAVADYIRMPRMSAYEVATFYSMLELKPVGRYKIEVCTNISCMLNGCERIVQHLETRLNIKLGETTPNQHYTLKEVECLGACIRAPVITVNGTYHENLTQEKVDSLLDEMDKNKIPS